MSKYSIVENPSPESWGSVLESQEAGNFWQTTDYGEVSKTAFSRTKVCRLLAMGDGNPVGIAQGIFSKYFGFGTCLTVRRAPIVNLEGSEKLDLLKNMLTALEDFGVKNRIIRAQVWWPDGWEGHEVFTDLGYTPAGKINAYTVNLNRTVEDLLKSFHRNKRKNIRKALKEEVSVFETSNQEDVRTFYSLLTAAATRNKFVAPPLSWFEAIWKLRKQKESTKIFLAKWNGKIVAGVFTTSHGKTVYALGAGSLSEGWKARPNDLLHWKAMEWACEHGFFKYSMGLVSEPIPTEESCSWSLWRWKREWNGDLETHTFFDKYYVPRYKFVLGAKKFIEHSYKNIRKIKFW